MNVLILLLILDMLSKEIWRPVVRNQELIDELPHPDERKFDPHLILRNPSGLLEINKDEDYEDKMPDLSLISTSKSCLYFIFQLMGYIHEQQMDIEEFFFGIELRWSRNRYEPGILFEYFLLLVHRYVDLIAVEEVDAQDLYDLSEDDGEKFDEKKKIAQVLLRLLNLSSTDFRKNQHILPKLHALIDSVMRQFPDAMYLVVLADFSEKGFESLYLVDDIFEGMQAGYSEYSFRNVQMFQTLNAFKDFPISSYFTPARLCSTFVCLLTKYCEPHYNETECKKAIVNVCAFLIKTLSTEAAFEAINQIFTELKKQAEMVDFLLEAILAIESEHLRGIIESPEFPIHPDESLKRIADNLTDVLTRKYDFWRIELKKLCPGKKLVAPLTAISEKSFVAGIIFERIFYKSLFDSKRKLEDVFDASVCERMQSVIDHSKILDGCKEAPEGLQLKTNLSRLLRTRQAKNDDFISIGITEDMRIRHALNVELKGAEQKRHDAQQTEWKRICRENNPPDYDDRRYQQAVQMNDLTQAAIRELKLSRKEFVREIFAEIDLDIERIRAQLKPIDDQCLSISKENSALKSSMKHLICERLGLPRQE
jgi:hypothetical protein